MALRGASKLVIAVLAALALAGTVVFAASSGASAPTEMRYACALQSNGLLRYATKPADCHSRSEVAVDLKATQVQACVLMQRFHALPKRGKARAASASSAGLLSVGATRRVARSSLCGRQTYGREQAIRLPGSSAAFFCAARGSRRLRHVSRAADCHRGETPVVVPAFRPVVPNIAGSQGNGNNGNIRANNDTASTDEAHGANIDVIANDTVPGPGNKHLSPTGLDTTGTVGQVTINPDNTVRYDPNGQFNNLANGQTATDTFKYRATDGPHTSAPATVTVTITGTDNAPVVTTSAGNAAYTENAPATAIDGALTVSDADDTHLEGATIRISSGLDLGDALVFANQNGITGSYNSGTGVLTLTGHATKADYQTALRSIQFSSTNDNPATSKTIEFKANDGDLDSAAATKGITVTRVNDAPSVGTSGGSASFTESGAAAAVDPAIAVSDPDSAQLQGAVASITGNFAAADGDTLAFVSQNGITGSYNAGTGVLTLTGNASVANYQAALRSITFSNTSHNPSTATRTVSFKVTDTSAADSNTANRDVTVAAVNDSPVVTTSGGNKAYTEGDPAATIDGGVTATDADSANLASAQVRISSGFQSGDDLVFADQNGITSSYNSGTGVLTLSGNASLANYQTALQSVKYRSATNDNPGTSKTVEFKANDGSSDSNLATKNLAITGVNDPPTVNTSGGSASYAENGTPAAVDPGVTTSDPDSTQLQGAVASITGNFAAADGDTLTFVDQNGITGSYNAGTGVLTLSGNASVANYQAALRSITFSNTSENPSTATRTVSFKATDTSGADSTNATRDVGVIAVDDAPVVNTTPGATPYSEGDPSAAVDIGVTVSDADNANLASAVVRVSSGFQSGDELTFTDQNGITGGYSSSTGVLTLTGTASKADYQTALRSVGYRNTSNNNISSPKQIGFVVNDGALNSTEAFRQIDITGVNDGPAITTTATALNYTEGDGAVAADNGLTLSDPEGDNISGATVSITGNFASADDTLAFTSQNGISGSYNAGTGVLTLSGTTSVSNYQTALQSVTYENGSQNPSGTKTLSFQATDTGSPPAASNVATRNITLNGVDDAPVVTTSGGNTDYTEGAAATAIDDSVTVSDADSTNLASARVRISSGFQAGDDLQFTDQNGITGSYNSGNGELTLSGSSSVANYQTALRSVAYSSGTNDNPSSPKVVEFKVNDGGLDSNLATKNIAVMIVDDPPTLTTTAAALSYTEGDGAVAADSGLTATDPDTAQLQGATVQITGNYVSADDTLAFADQSGITGSYDTTTGKLTLVGDASVADYQAALRSVTYTNSSQSPTGTKTISFRGTDTDSVASNIATRTVNLNGVNDAPVVTTTGGSTPYTEGGSATTIDSGVTVSDADSANIASGQVQISTGAQSGDSLTFTNQNGISGTYDSVTATLALTGSSSVANYQTALQSVKFVSTNNNPVASKDVQFKVNDGTVDSNVATKNIAVTPVNSPPDVNAAAGPTYTEDDPAVTANSGLTVS
ncbi:MAG: large repetitive protein, partial [Actinomycetota bacterium]|nr:large repetitive protein [Actinomycetota bacterium]